jgi:hypothetical protein
MTTITLEVHHLPGDLPDADTDVLVLAEGDTEMQLGAYVGEESDGPVWVDAQGEILPRVVAWADMPVVGKREHLHVEIITGQRVDLAAPWRLPA